MKSSPQLFAIASFFLLITACKHKNRKEDMNGGPCSYTDIRMPAVLARLNTVDSNNVEAWFTIDHAGMADTVSYFDINNYGRLSQHDLDTSGIKVGDTCLLIESNIQTGSCDPHLERIYLQKFKP